MLKSNNIFISIFIDFLSKISCSCFFCDFDHIIEKIQENKNLQKKSWHRIGKSIHCILVCQFAGEISNKINKQVLSFAAPHGNGFAKYNETGHKTTGKSHLAALEHFPARSALCDIYTHIHDANDVSYAQLPCNPCNIGVTVLCPCVCARFICLVVLLASDDCLPCLVYGIFISQ